MKFLILLLILLVFTPAFGALSDTTGFVTKFDVDASGHVFEVQTISNFDISDFEFNQDKKRLTFYILSSLENNLAEVNIPSNLLSGNFTFFLNDQVHPFKIISNDRISFITLNFTGSGNNKLDIIGTTYLNGLDEIEKTDDAQKNTSNNEEGGGCLIATATFGSELAPQVQQLREIRDNHLLKTESGKIFMKNFNHFYYMFSPIISDYERENPLFRDLVKITLIPLLSSLSILTYVDVDSEIEVLGYGISLIIFNLSMYFVAPLFVIHKLRKI